MRSAMITAASFLVTACASALPPGTDPGSNGEGECPIEARNETEVTLAITYRAGVIRIGELPPGARLRFNVACDEPNIVVLGRKEAAMGSSGATCNVSARVAPVRNQVVVATLAMTRSARRSANPTGCRRGSDDFSTLSALTTFANDNPTRGWS